MATPQNTKRSRNSVWQQFKKFCDTRKFSDGSGTYISEVSNILDDYTFNMKKCDGKDYKDSTLKIMWNTTAKMVQELNFTSFNVKMNPFSDIEFKTSLSREIVVMDSQNIFVGNG